MSLGDVTKGCTFLNFTASHDGVGVRPLEGLVPDVVRRAFIARFGADGESAEP